MDPPASFRSGALDPGADIAEVRRQLGPMTINSALGSRWSFSIQRADHAVRELWSSRVNTFGAGSGPTHGARDTARPGSQLGRWSSDQ